MTTDSRTGSAARSSNISLTAICDGAVAAVTPNRITALRVVMCPLSIWLLSGGPAGARVLGTLLIATSMLMDALDGYVARKRHLATELGGDFDVCADRIVEVCYWMFFATAGVLNIWLAMLACSRGVLTDFLRLTKLRRLGSTRPGSATGTGILVAAVVGSSFGRSAYVSSKASAFLLAAATMWASDIEGMLQIQGALIVTVIASMLSFSVAVLVSFYVLRTFLMIVDTRLLFTLRS